MCPLDPQSPSDPSPTPEPQGPPSSEPSPSPEPAGSGAPSRPAGGSRLAVDVGPAFDDENRPQGTPLFDDEPDGEGVAGPTIEWDEQVVAMLLTSKGVAMHQFLAVEKGVSQEWKYTADDLSAIAPPLTRVLNRYDATRAAAAAGDELALGIGFFGYAMRSYNERREAIARLEQEPPQPIAGIRQTDLPIVPNPTPEWENPLGDPLIPEPRLGGGKQRP